MSDKKEYVVVDAVAYPKGTEPKSLRETQEVKAPVLPKIRRDIQAGDYQTHAPKAVEKEQSNAEDN